MEIKEKNGYFFIKCGEKKAVLAYSHLDKIADDADMYVNFSKKDDRGYFVYNPGEYEVKDIFCMVNEKKGKQAYLVDMCDITVLLIPEIIDLNEKDLEQLGQVDVLIIGNGVEVSSELVKYVGRIDPQIYLLQKDAKKDELEKAFGVQVDEVDKKLKIKASEFDNEEYKMQLLLIK